VAGYSASRFRCQHILLGKRTANFIYVVLKKSLKFYYWCKKITNLSILQLVFSVFQAWNMCFARSNYFLSQYVISCHKFLWTYGTSRVPHVASLLPAGTLLASLFPSHFLHFLCSLPLTLSLPSTLSAGWEAKKLVFCFPFKILFCGV
jgi:hypothetical protein